MIILNSGGTSSSAIRSHGISSELRRELQPSLERAIEKLCSAREEELLGFMDLPELDVEPILTWAEEKKTLVDDVIVIGIGGSSLGARAILETERKREDYPTVHFSENVDPDHFTYLLERVNLERTLVVVITKSGTTIETMSKFAVLWSKLQSIHQDKAHEYVVAITDPEKGSLRELARKYQFDCFPVPENVGGRFSVLSHVGLVPLALQGYPIQRLLNGAAETRTIGLQRDCSFKEEGNTVRYKNPVIQSAADHYLLSERGVSQTVLFTYSDSLYPLTDWFCQLWGESLGKARDLSGRPVHCGLTPIKALGVIDQHSQLQLYMEGPNDKHIMFLEVEEFSEKVVVPEMDGFPESLEHLIGKDLGVIMNAELKGTQLALEKAQRPTSRISLSKITPETVGGFIMFWELVTAVMGELLDINAFDQPGVELGKKIAHSLLGKKGAETIVKDCDSANSVLSSIQKKI